MWTDIALEQPATCHNNEKTGGTIGVTMKEEAHMQWWLRVRERGVITEETCSMFDMCDQVEPQHKESSKARISRDHFQSLAGLLGMIRLTPRMFQRNILVISAI